MILKKKMSDEKTITINKQDLWKYSTFVLIAAVLIGGVFLLTGNNGGVNGNVINTGTEGSITVPSADDDPFLGPENAKVTVIEFSDYECSWCAVASGLNEQLLNNARSQLGASYEPVVPMLKELAAEGKIKFVYKDFPAHSNSQKAAEASQCANDQGKFWEYHDLLFTNFGELSGANLEQYAISLGLNTNQFNDCLDSGKHTSEVQKDLAEARAAGVKGTPGFYINDQLVSGAASAEQIRLVIDSELAA